MRHRLHNAWFHLRRWGRAWAALIGIPLAINIVLVAIGLAVQAVLAGQAGWLPFRIHDEAETVLATIASIMATATALLYSALLVVQQLTASQFSPRLVSGIPRDPWVQTGAGLTLGTTAYSLLTLALLRAHTAVDQTAGVVIAMALAAGAFVAFILTLLHISQMIQVNTVIHRVASETAEAIRCRMHTSRHPAAADPQVVADHPPQRIRATHSGYLQTVDYDELLALALDVGVAIQVTQPIGEFVTRDVTVFEVYTAGNLAPRFVDKLRDTLAIGKTPTIEQDPEFGLRLLVDIALRALSPAINDPSTAVTCIDHMEDLLLLAADHFDEDEVERQHEGEWVIRHCPTTFTRLLDRACRQLRHYGARDYAVQIRLQRLLFELAERTRAPERLNAIEGHAEGLWAAIERCGWPEHDQAVPRARHARIVETIARRRSEAGSGDA